MKTVIPILLILATMIYIISNDGQSSSESSSQSSITSGEESPRRTRLTPESAFDKISEIRAQTPDSATSFASIQSLAGKLSDHDLQSLVREIGLGKTQGYDAWLRSALFAEWARRDLQAVVDYIRSPDKSGTTYDSALQQAYFAIFRGSRPHDPEAALEHLHTLCSKHELGKYGSGSNWIEHIHLNLFQELSQLDPDKAWELLPPPSSPEEKRTHKSVKVHRAALEGLFSGLTNKDLIAQFADRWMETYHQPDADSPKFQLTINTSSFYDPVPQSNADATTITSIWMNSDPAAALDWLYSKASSEPSLASNRTYRAFSDWAYRNPQQALTALQSKLYPEYSTSIATNLLRANPHLLPDLSKIQNPTFSLHDAIAGSTTLNAMHEGAAQYPDPNKKNRPPDYQARYDSYRAVIQSPGIFEERLQQQLIDSLDRNFESTLKP